MKVRSKSSIESSASLSTLKIPTAKVFEPLLQPARYKGAHGGRGSGKSHFFGELLVETCQAERGTLAVCIREAQRTLAQSSKRLIESKIAALGIGSGFKLYSDKIETPGDGIIIFRGMQYDAGKYRLMMKTRDAPLQNRCRRCSGPVWRGRQRNASTRICERSMRGCRVRATSRMWSRCITHGRWADDPDAPKRPVKRKSRSIGLHKIS